jgi:RNA polymerase sigma factor (sigma-70 family)
MRNMLAHGRAALDSFEFFYGQYQDVLRAAAARHVRGLAEVEDVVQEALIRVVREFPSWERDHRLRNALRAVRCASVDALRREHGTGERPELVTFDFSALDATEEDCPVPSGMGAALARRSEGSPLAESGVLEDSLSRLSREELRVLLGIAHRGETPDEVADELRLSQGRVAYLYDEGRTHVRALIRHGRGDGLAGVERLALIELETGRLTGRRRRRAQRHLDDCQVCRAIEVLERRVGPSGDWTGPERRGPEGSAGRL